MSIEERLNCSEKISHFVIIIFYVRFLFLDLFEHLFDDLFFHFQIESCLSHTLQMTMTVHINSIFYQHLSSQHSIVY